MKKRPTRVEPQLGQHTITIIMMMIYIFRKSDVCENGKSTHEETIHYICSPQALIHVHQDLYSENDNCYCNSNEHHADELHNTFNYFLHLQLLVSADITFIVPRYIPIEQLNVKVPALSGVKSMMFSPIASGL